MLCPECDNPETELVCFESIPLSIESFRVILLLRSFQIVLPKKQMISQKCIACGYLVNVDMRHKLTTFILKNPPGQEGATTPASKKGKKAKKDDKTKAQNGSAEIIEQTDIPKQQEKNIDSDEHHEVRKSADFMEAVRLPMNT